MVGHGEIDDAVVEIAKFLLDGVDQLGVRLDQQAAPAEPAQKIIAVGPPTAHHPDIDQHPIGAGHVHHRADQQGCFAKLRKFREESVRSTGEIMVGKGGAILVKFVGRQERI